MMQTIWERYVFRETLKVFFLFLGCFYFLYAMIDYSSHMQDFTFGKTIQFSHIGTYYFFQFIKRADLLLPLSMLIATMKVLLSLNAHRELVALQASGIPFQKIVRPILFIGACCTLFNWASFEWVLPTSLNFLDKFREQYLKHSYRGMRKEPIHVIYLKDQSKIIYQSQNGDGSYFDLFWVRSSDEIWRMKTLSADFANPVGTFVDHIQRNAAGNFEKTESFPSYRFPSLKALPDLSGKGYVPLENRKMSELLRMALQIKKTTAFEQAQALTQLLFKCAMPLLSVLVILGIAPFCVRYNRTLPLLFIYSFALFAFIAFFTLMDAAVILSENLVVSPFLAILAPMAICIALFSYRFAKTH